MDFNWRVIGRLALSFLIALLGGVIIHLLTR